MTGLLSAHFGTGLSSTLPTLPALLPWVAVRQRFERFHETILLTPAQQLDGYRKRAGVVSCLNRHYHGSTSDTDNSFFIGSWGKNTAVRPPRDVDVYFLLPPAVYQRFQSHFYNKQSSLLQEVKGVLGITYPNTDMRGDGQVVMVKFDTYSVEVVPAFPLEGGGYWICDTNNGGSYRRTDPWAELTHIENVDSANAKNLRPLVRMLKVWQAYCSVPVKSFQLELVAADFLAQSPWRLNDFFYFDWLCRDFFAYLYCRANTYLSVPGTWELVHLGDAWRTRAEAAYHRAVKACDYERENRVVEAGDEWQKIFGTDIPRSI